MLIELNKKLDKLYSEIKLKEKLELDRDLTEKEMYIKKRELDEYRILLEKEQKDVEQLEKLSLKSFVFTVVGKKETKLFDEKKELVNAKMKYDKMDFEYKQLKSDLESIMHRLKIIGNMENKYAETLELKKQAIKKLSVEINDELSDYDYKIKSLHKNNVEIKEAIRAGATTKGYLEAAQKSLKSASGWNTFDMFTRGGIFTTAIKHDHISKASQRLSKAKSSLIKFSKELKDVDKSINMSKTKIDGISIFFDVFFDNIFLDFSIGNKIDEALRNIKRNLVKVNDYLKDLERTKQKNKDAIRVTNKKIKELVSSY